MTTPKNLTVAERMTALYVDGKNIRRRSWIAGLYILFKDRRLQWSNGSTVYNDRETLEYLHNSEVDGWEIYTPPLPELVQVEGWGTPISWTNDGLSVAVTQREHRDRIAIRDESPIKTILAHNAAAYVLNRDAAGLRKMADEIEGK